jgi:hypothetical protein
MREIKPVRKANLPCYPNKEYVKSHPELLDKLPARWQRSRQVVAAAGLLASFALTAAGCKTEPPLASAMPLVLTSPGFLGGIDIAPFVSERDALITINEAIKGKYPNANFSFATADSSKPIVYVFNNGVDDGYESVMIHYKTIDVFDTSVGLGFEYINEDERSDGVEFTDKSVLHADKDHAYVLAMNPQQASDEALGEAEIHRQVVEFLNWLKAEGIGE